MSEGPISAQFEGADWSRGAGSYEAHALPWTTDDLEALDFIARLAALVPRPRVNLTRFHGVFAPNSRWRAQITPAGRGKHGVLIEKPERRLDCHW